MINDHQPQLIPPLPYLYLLEPANHTDWDQVTPLAWDSAATDQSTATNGPVTRQVRADLY